METILHATLLYDFYSDLLTEKQREFFELYHFNDFSLSEIGEQQHITPQGVRDLIKRTEKILMEYEEKLLLVQKFGKQKELVGQISQMLDALIQKEPQPLKSELENIKSMALSLVDEDRNNEKL